MRSFFLATILLCVSITYGKQISDVEVADFRLGITAHTKGMGINFRTILNENDGGISNFFNVDLVSWKYAKEKKVYNPNLPDPTPYTYGKLSRLYALHLGLGKQIILAQRNTRNAIGIQVLGSAGLSVGALKPNYVDLQKTAPNGEFIVVSEKYNPAKQTPNEILGYSSYSKGFDELKALPGLYAKVGINVEWGNYLSESKSVEVGTMFDFFPGRPNVMYGLTNKTVFSSFYISFAFGL